MLFDPLASFLEVVRVNSEPLTNLLQHVRGCWQPSDEPLKVVATFEDSNYLSQGCPLILCHRVLILSKAAVRGIT
jgi:hypothetical protein